MKAQDVVPSSMWVCVCERDRLQALTVANITVQISINNTIWFQIKGANKCVQAHLASQIQSTDGYAAGQLLWRKKMLMSIHCRAQSQKNRGNGLIFLASVLSKVTVTARNGAAVSGTQQCLSLAVCLLASSWLVRRSRLPWIKLLANMCKYGKSPLCSLFLLRAN